MAFCNYFCYFSILSRLKIFKYVPPLHIIFPPLCCCLNHFYPYISSNQPDIWGRAYIYEEDLHYEYLDTLYYKKLLPQFRDKWDAPRKHHFMTGYLQSRDKLSPPVQIGNHVHKSWSAIMLSSLYLTYNGLNLLHKQCIPVYLFICIW